MKPPPIPSDAASWLVTHAVGKDVVSAAWEKCWEAGKVAGAFESGLSFGRGVLTGVVGTVAVVGFGMLCIGVSIAIYHFVAKRGAR